jgi:hypothetical protein
MPSSTVWWREAVFYQIYIRSFADGNGDGIGDLAGLRSRLPYLADLGVDALWITPFYPSPMADHGYDVADPRDVEPVFGDLAEFDALLADAHRLGLRVTIDLVPNHSSTTSGSRRRWPRRPARPSGRGTCSGTAGGTTAARRRTTGRRSSAVRRGRGCPTASGTCTSSRPSSRT